MEQHTHQIHPFASSLSLVGLKELEEKRFDEEVNNARKENFCYSCGLPIQNECRRSNCVNGKNNLECLAVRDMETSTLIEIIEKRFPRISITKEGDHWNIGYNGSKRQIGGYAKRVDLQIAVEMILKIGTSGTTASWATGKLVITPKESEPIDIVKATMYEVYYDATDVYRAEVAN